MKVLMALVVLVFAQSAWAQDDRMRIYDEEMIPLVKEFAEKGGLPSEVEMDQLMGMVRRFNEATNPAAAKEVVELKPHFLSTFLNAEGVTTAALAMCAANNDVLRPCEEAGQYLQTMTEQCSDVFLGTFDLDQYPEFPLDTFDAEYGTSGDPNLILMAPNPVANHARTTVRVRGTPTPDTVAIVLCPQESRTFGHVLRFLDRSPE